MRRAAGEEPANSEGAKTQRCVCVDADPQCHNFCLSRSVFLRCNRQGVHFRLESYLFVI